MNTSLDLITILAAIIAVVVLFRLRNVLGRKTGDESSREASRAERYARDARGPVGGSDNVIPMPRPTAADAGAASGDAAPDENESAPRKSAAYAGPAADVVAEIQRADSEFDVPHFLVGARAAYEMIVTAFAEGNRKLLKQLLVREVFEGFQTAIAEREARGETVNMQFIGIDAAEIIDAELRNKVARVTVKFVSQLTQAVSDRAGSVIEGDPKAVRTVTDVWTFMRDVSSRDPNWKLAATQSAN